MKKNELINKTLAGLMIAAMTAGVCPTTAFAVTGAQVAKDGTYKATAHVTRTEEDSDDEWDEYDVEVSLTVADGKFTDIKVTPASGYDSGNDSYFNKAYNKSKGIKTLLEGKEATADAVNSWDSVSGATRTSKAVKEAAAAAIAKAEEKTTAVEVNTEKLQAAITKAEGLKEADYTADSWKTMQDALTEAKAALAAKESQEKVDAAESKLTKAIDGLVKAAAEVNVEKLQTAIKKAEGLTEADYTADSWKTMQNALTEAKAALEAKESQDKVDAAEAKLTKAIDALEKNAVAKEVYVLMNIPYDKFYAAEGDDDADAVTSATLNKTRSSLAAGSYHVNSDGSDITGIVYPVKLDDASALEKLTQVTDSSKVDITVSMKGKETTTTYEGKDALFESPSYAYYILSETPSYYKEATVNADGTLSFGKAEGAEVQTLSNVTADFRTSSKYGDYQMNLSGLPDDITTVYGVVVGTKEGDSYGLRHVENIWKISKLAWSTGFVTTAHGNQLQYKDYVPMMGQTINKVTYYTNAGIYEIPMSVYVPVKFDGSVEVADAKASSGETKVTLNNLPSDYEAEYSVEGLENVKVENSVLTYTATDAKVGKYTLKVTDKSGKYADISADFTLTTEVTPITYDSDQKALVPADGYSADDVAAYVKNITSVSVDGKAYTASGKGDVKLINEDGSINTEAVPFADAKEGQKFEIEVTAAGYENNYKFTYTAESQYKYVYAGLSWAEYWANEGVYAAGDASSSDDVDTKGEHDKGAFDTVTRATTNHGLHRGSYQCTAIIEGANGKEYKVSHWTDGNTAVLTDGSTITFEKGNITEADGSTTTMVEYDVTGIKYVPVKVAAADYEDFCKTYAVVENGMDLTGGYGEGELASYAVKANVTAQTNGLKTVTKNADGSFSFSSREDGSESGIEGQALKSAPSAEEAGLTVKEANGSYGEFLRVDLTTNFADLGANMQAVKWTYYGEDSTYTNALVSYGTKFAADNWMHKKMGIQLGLTDSLRCQLPEGTDGTGYWTITISALGYEDATYQFQATDENIVKPDPVQDTTALEAAIARAEALNEADYTADSWASMQTELAEAKEELEAKHSQSAVNEATEHLNAAIDALVKNQVEEAGYVLMNIPYAEFYKAEVNNDVDVDVFTSATLNKTRTPGLSGGSYHANTDGSKINGITFPVKVGEGVDLSKYTQVTDNDSVEITVTNRGQTSTTTYTGKDALYQNADYAYYTLSETPSYYKEVSVDAEGNLVFGKTVGDVTELDGFTGDLSTETGYGDYQLDITGLRDKLTELGVTNVNAVVVDTKEGSSYGLRHLENIWRMEELAWATGFTESVHGCPTSSEHYKAMMGQTITSVTYYTDKGMYSVPLGEIYVPVKFAHELSVENASVTAGQTNVTVTGLPDDYDAEYKVEGLNGVSVQNGVLSFDNAAKGKYTLTISDKSGKYADITTDFELYTEAMPAAYDDDKKSLVKTADATDEEFADYIKNITVVNVNGTDYRATGRGATVIINEDGSIKTDAAPFAEGDTFEITVTSTGYQPVSFTYTTKVAPEPVVVDTSALEAVIAKAEALKESDYTEASWKHFKTELSAAKAVLEAKESQEAVDEAAKTLQLEIDALVKATPDNKKDETEAVDTSSLEKLIASAKDLKKNDYTAATWTTLQNALANAEKAVEAKESQKSIDAAEKNLQAAIDGLKKASATINKNNTTNNNKKNNTTTTTKKNNTTTSKKSPKTGDPVSVLGLLGAAVSSLGIGGLGLKLRRKSRREDEE